MEINKAVIGAAGYGTRFLPATKVQPKEMLPLVDRPIIQYLVEEAVDSGIEEVVIVTRARAHSLEDHFDSNLELEMLLEQDGKLDRLEKVKRLQTLADFAFVRQHGDLPYGNATPLLATKHLLGDEPFVYMFGDDLVRSEVPATWQLIEKFQEEEPAALIATQEVPWEEVSRYGVMSFSEGNQVEKIKEKPPLEKADSNQAQFGRFILTKKVVEEAEEMPPGKEGELWLTDALNRVARRDRVLAETIDGEWLTTGDPLRYMKAMIKFALQREELGDELEDFLKELVC
ncbi:MAG: UTP--glucose-1-phosphate uridylyltransferase [Candidatus Bipolaricaulota bacterium]